MSGIWACAVAGAVGSVRWVTRRTPRWTRRGAQRGPSSRIHREAPQLAVQHLRRHFHGTDAVLVERVIDRRNLPGEGIVQRGIDERRGDPHTKRRHGLWPGRFAALCPVRLC